MTVCNMSIEGGARVFVGVADAAVHTQTVDDVQDHVLCGHPGPELSVDHDAPHRELVHGQGLRCQYVAYLGGADAKRDGSEGPVGRGVRVAAADGHTRLGQPRFRSHDVNDALLAAFRRKIPDIVALHVLLQSHQHLFGKRVTKRPKLRRRRDDVIHGRERPIGIRYR